MKKRFQVYCLLFFTGLLCGCSSAQNTETDVQMTEESLSPLSAAPNEADSTDTVSKGSRDNTPVCLVPSADHAVTYGNDSVIIDASNCDNGYIMAQYLGSVSKVKLQLTGTDKVTYTYNLTSSPDAFPLTSGNGDYHVAVFENIQNDQYSTLYETTISVKITDEFLPYLYPNQYVAFKESDACIQLAGELSLSANSDLDVVSSIYNYIISNITYDHDRASSVQSGYIPDLDHVLNEKKGICFDYASLMAAMLRSQQIPTRLEIGYAGEAYHAWITTYITDVGWVNGIIEFDGTSWTLMDPTFASSSGDKAIKKFIGDGSNYITKYVY